MTAPVPQSAVPDGEDVRRPHLVDASAPAMRMLMRRVSSRQMGADDAVDVLLDWPNRATALDGEDVPARLDAAAAVLNVREPYSCAATNLRGVATSLRLCSPETRAAVAAALARIPHEETREDSAGE